MSEVEPEVPAEDALLSDGGAIEAGEFEDEEGAAETAETPDSDDGSAGEVVQPPDAEPDAE